MSLFKTDPQAALDKARRKLTSVDENLATLRASGPRCCFRLKMPALL